MVFNSLAQPLDFGDGLVLRNRISMASLTRSRSVPVDVPTDLNVTYYRQRAAGKPGLILSEGTLVSSQGCQWGHVGNIYSDEHVAGWKKITDACHQEGTPIFAQLWHVGRIAHPDMPLQGDKPVSAPSAIAARGGKFHDLGKCGNVPPARAHPDPSELVEEFRHGAKNAKAAGFDGVEAHASHGYLINQFMDKYANFREDQWGGNTENRVRFCKEVIGALLESFPANRIGIKLNPCGGMNDVGMEKDDTIETYTNLITFLVKTGVAYINLSEPMVTNLTPPDGINAMKDSVKDMDVFDQFGPLIRGSSTKLLANGGFTPAEAEEWISQGKCDGVAFGRAFINTPDFPKRVFSGLAMNDAFGRADNPKTWYGWRKDPAEGYTDWPTHEAIMAK